MLVFEFCAENLTLLDKAIAAGAGRIELCDNLAVGGTTPSLGVIKEAVKLTREQSVDLCVIIRPRGGDFVYTDSEVEAMLTDAQNDMRVLLLHLRPTELENKTLQEGLQMILKELTDKSNIRVVYKDMVKKVPKRIENNLFRIAQEFISNTLKHAKASQIEVYLYQNSQEIQLKMLDNGVGYDLNASTDEMSYGLKNIQERVDEMAGTVQFLSAKGKGTSIDVRVPILRGEDNVE